jgi:mannose-6-phosphate isomerase-like protein (cupin superfamily)
MGSFQSLAAADAPVVTAPDGSRVRIGPAVAAGSAAIFELDAGQVASAVVHASVDELWFVHAGRGRLWRAGGGVEETVELLPGLMLSIPCGTRFQFCAADDQGLVVFGVTLPPWPGPQEASAVVGPFRPSSSSSARG